MGRILVETILLVGRGCLLSVLPGLWWSVFIPTKSGHSRVKLNSKFHTAQYPDLGEIISGHVMNNSVHGALRVVSGKFPKFAGGKWCQLNSARCTTLAPWHHLIGSHIRTASRSVEYCETIKRAAMSIRVPGILDDMSERQRYLAARVDVLSDEVPRLRSQHVREASRARAHIRLGGGRGFGCGPQGRGRYHRPGY